MTNLSQTIRMIRQRLGKTMIEFAEMIGCRQSTISRYESGKLVPGRSVLLLLLQLAEGAERKPILEALGVAPAAASGWTDRDLVAALQTFEQYLAAAPQSQPQASDASLANFARAAKRIIEAGSEVDPAVVSILQQWSQHGGDPKALEHFRNIASYLEVELSVLGPGSKSARQRSKSSRKPRSQSEP